MAVGDLVKVDKPALVVQRTALPELPPQVRDIVADRCGDRTLAIKDILRADPAENLLPITDALVLRGPAAGSSDDALPLAKAPRLAGHVSPGEAASHLERAGRCI